MRDAPCVMERQARMDTLDTVQGEISACFRKPDFVRGEAGLPDRKRVIDAEKEQRDDDRLWRCRKEAESRGQHTCHRNPHQNPSPESKQIKNRIRLHLLAISCQILHEKLKYYRFLLPMLPQ